ncbi:hypothetical protein F5Y18DRAFT_422131 [Xylariaceae sp. FL1019]|nr:hypothetical protein F5Y18DRAFT_422131 [Xylariaceae sp. FL1019]
MSTETDTALDSGLFAIALSDSETEGTSKKPTQEERTGQSEADWQAIKDTYSVKIENGEIWQTVKLPLGPRVSKPEAQTLLHAVEELYFFRRFGEAVQFVSKVLDSAEEGCIDGDVLKTLRYYERKCREKAEMQE